MFPSPLQRALRRGLASDGDLAEEIGRLRDYKIRSRKDAKAIVGALAMLADDSSKKTGWLSPLHALVGLFQDVDGRDVPAFDVLADDGMRELIRVFDALKTNPSDDDAEDLLFTLKIMAMYGTHKGAEFVVEAALIPIKPDDYLWSVILSAFSEGHPERDFIFDSLSESLPRGFVAVALLDVANGEAIAGRLKDHPFDSDVGKERIRAWLASRDPATWSYARSATAALPFIHGAIRDELLGLAREHADTGVRIEAARASARRGQKIGLEMLSDYCLDPNYSSTAVTYLKELGQEDVIPPEATDPDFQAKAEFANWLSHPSELGRPPDELEIVDRRILMWPPQGEETSLWLIKYVLRDSSGLEGDDVDCGLVGSMTWCFFSYRMHQRPPEDCYAIHCCWELGLQDAEVDDPSEYAGMLNQWAEGSLSNPVVTHVLELAPELQYGRRMVALATAEKNGEQGWAVLDGQDSSWYAKSEMPDDVFDTTVLEVHVGRKLLGFSDTPDRKRYLANVQEPPSPAAIVAAYDKLLEECKEGNIDRKRALLADWGSPLGKHMANYANACEQVGRENKAESLARAYQIVLDAVQEMPPDKAEDAYGFSGPLNDNFEAFVDSLVQIDRRSEICAAVQLLQTHWEHNSGYGQLGTAAFKSGDFKTAERLFLKLRESHQDWRRSEEMRLLARVWHQGGRENEARALLIDCLQGLAKEATEATGSDRKLFEDWYQNHRNTFLSLYPGHWEELKTAGLLESTLI